ncbi:polysaccharide biosynthesis tyrosine autokinase [Calidifontibacter sp. DB0510]|uniref:non-specific protein-tyrosine kinase n=1 Tax=Metallococcus carri TaxID=1656884 RepID=A0A967EFE8_9MICO|nr:polysaccharide biosynthesis tyrosine autokinase [Metallococcus carri]NHN56566.1 polysaccharide biosynthesis tyrosine autokinase [Metallococcus carri]NOP38865.1 polysaccharide biosynthesis tyrosine autokinase [Calidifontibacter sp. DB2511S]
MTIIDFVRVLRASARVLLLGLLLGVLLGFGYSFTKPKLYQATAQGAVVAGSSASTGDAFSSMSLATSKAQQYAALASSGPVAQAAAKTAGVPVGAGSISAAPGTGGTIINFTVTSRDPEVARKLADAAVTATRDEGRKMDTLTATGGNAGNSVVSIFPFDNATQPSKPFSPNIPLYLTLGGILGALAAFAYVLVRRKLDRRVNHVAEIEKIVHASVLGVIPKVNELSGKRRGGLGRLGPASEAMRMLRTNLRFVDVDNPPRSIVITSANPGEGKSTVSANLARVLAEAGQPVVLVDADLRKPMAATIFDVDASVGLTQVLAGDVAPADVIVASEHENLHVLPAGRVPPNPSELLGSQRMAQLVQYLAKDYLVLLDAPPLLPVTDAGLLSAHCDGAILVLQVGKSRVEHAQLSAKMMDHVKARLYGVVLNMAPRRGLGSVIYGYGYGGKAYGGYGYGYGSKSKKAPQAPAVMPDSDPATRPAAAAAEATPAEEPKSRAHRRRLSRR